MAEKILLVDDEADVRFLISKFLKLQGYEVVTAENPQLALAAADGSALSTIILDVNLSDLTGTDGTALLSRLKQKHPTAPIILYTGLAGEDAELKDMLKLGVHAHVPKGAPLDALLKAVQSAAKAPVQSAVPRQK